MQGKAIGLVYVENNSTGGIASLYCEGDTTNWILTPDGSQYAWVDNKYAWGLGFFTANGIEYSWETPYKKDKNSTFYQSGDIVIEVKRAYQENDIVEEFTFKNISDKELKLTNIGIFTPWNDNYPDAKTCIWNRCNAHIWPAGDATWVKSVRMGGKGSGVGLVVTEGNITGYEVFERGRNTGHSNFRGVIALDIQDFTLQSKEKYTVVWRLFAHEGDFEKQIIERKGVVAKVEKYVLNVGETTRITFQSAGKTDTIQFKAIQTGEVRVPYAYGKGKQTWVDLLVIDNEQDLIRRRVEFILKHQQMNNESDPRFGAYMIYDNEGDSILTNDQGRSDLDEGRERTGMGIFLAMYAKLHPNDTLLASLQRYASFVKKLQKEDFYTTSSVMHKSKSRGYNYAWISDFWFRMYELTKDRDYAMRGYGTLKALFKYFGYDFYCIDYPVIAGLCALKDAGMEKEADTLVADFKRVGDGYVERGLDFPRHEVNYEQSIVAPAVQFLCELFIVTKDNKYLRMAEEILPALEAFAGSQPSFRLNDIAIRHWDGYWFGKNQLWGDVFPHYWSAISAGAYYWYAIATEKQEYLKRAQNIVRNNLCNIQEDGRATCAFVYPNRVNKKNAHKADAYANDQDFALVFYQLVFNNPLERINK